MTDLIKPTNIAGVYLVELSHSNDSRGSFVKVLDPVLHKKFSTNFGVPEIFYTHSCRNVLRGMHFGAPPYDHEKIVHCCYGEVLDIVLDLRLTSPTYGKSQAFNLSSRCPKILYLPRGIAHGFKVISEFCTVMYVTSKPFDSRFDSGILWNSFGADWGITNPIISSRDLNLQSFKSIKYDLFKD